MKFSTIVSAAVLCAKVIASPETPQDNEKRDVSSICSIGIARLIGSIHWDLTVYNCPQVLRQDTNIVSTLKQQAMDKGQSISIAGPSASISITNVDNSPVFDYDNQDLNATIYGLLTTGDTKVELQFNSQDGNYNWTTASGGCGPGSTIFSAGRESWSCDFPCTIPAGEL